MLIYSFSIFSMRHFIWEYISGKGKSTYIFVFNWALHLGIYKWKGKVHLYIRGGYIREYVSEKNGLNFICNIVGL